MKLLLKKSAVLSVFSVLLIFLTLPVFAHPGSLDWQGGHYDRKTGEYHYHHGYSAHQHENGECPYDFHDNANTEYTPQDEKQTNSSSSTTRYYYDFEEFEEFTTNNFNNSANNSIKEETTTNSNTQTSKKSFFSILGDIVKYFFLFVLFLLVCYPLIGIVWILFLQPICEYISSFIKLIKQNIEIKNKLYERKNIKYSIFPLAKQNKLLNELWFDVEREDAIKELIHFDCLSLKDAFPDDVLLLNTFELKFVNADNKHRPFSRYTIYNRYKEDKLHSVYKCDFYAWNEEVSLSFPNNGKYSLCEICWKSTDMNDYPDLFMPEWYKQYKEVKDKMDKYHITASDIKQRKQEEIASQLKNSDFNIWDQEIHSKIEQVKRIKRSVDVIIISYDESTKKAIVEGSEGNEYITSFSSCNCKDFSLHKLPCKHMYKLAAIHGGIDFSKYV